MRAVRAAVVVPALFAVTFKVIANPQMALFATFGGFATLVIANFGGSRKDKFVAHASLAVVGSLALIIGTLVSGTTWLAALVTIPVTFAIFFGGVAGPNAVSGSTAAMFAYVLPVASVGGAATIPSRLAGWWLASAAGTIAVLLLSPRTPGDKLRAAAAELAGELASRVNAAAGGESTPPDAMRAAKEKLKTTFLAAPFRPTGLAIADQALNSLVQSLDWAAAQVADAFDGHVKLSMACPQDRNLLRAAAAMLSDVDTLLAGREANPDFGALEQARADSAAHLRDLSGRPGEPDARIAAAHAVHAQGLSVTARDCAADALIASRRAAPETIAAARRVWYGLEPAAPPTVPAQGAAPERADGTRAATASTVPVIPNGHSRLSSLSSSPRVAGLAGATAVVARHATVRSVWFLNSLRGALALAAAVAVADLTSVQHGFWVVLGTLSVLRTSAASTGATAWRALAGTVIGFAVGAALLIGIGTAQSALWVALPLAVLVAAYAPGTMPFLVGQAAFTVTIVVLFNLLAPAGWKVGLLRVEDVAIGCAVSLVVGVLFWPHGASSVVGQDLSDAFRSGAEYLTQAVDWALSELMLPPAAAMAAVGAGIRLEDAMRGYLAEQGSKRMGKEDLWTLLNGSRRLRLTANTLAGLRQAETAPGLPAGAACLPLAGSGEYAGAPACVTLRSEAAGLAGFYEKVAGEVGRTGRSARATEPVRILAPPVLAPAVPRAGAAPPDGAEALSRAAAARGATMGVDGAASAGGVASVDAAGSVDGALEHDLPHPHLLWVQEHLRHLSQSAQMLSDPVLRLAEIRRRPWWR
jgi:uncharacterized membrane protein YccC